MEGRRSSTPSPPRRRTSRPRRARDPRRLPGRGTRRGRSVRGRRGPPLGPEPGRFIPRLARPLLGAICSPIRLNVDAWRALVHRTPPESQGARSIAPRARSRGRAEHPVEVVPLGESRNSSLALPEPDRPHDPAWPGAYIDHLPFGWSRPRQAPLHLGRYRRRVRRRWSSRPAGGASSRPCRRRGSTTASVNAAGPDVGRCAFAPEGDSSPRCPPAARDAPGARSSAASGTARTSRSTWLSTAAVPPGRAASPPVPPGSKGWPGSCPGPSWPIAAIRISGTSDSAAPRAARPRLVPGRGPRARRARRRDRRRDRPGLRRGGRCVRSLAASPVPPGPRSGLEDPGRRHPPGSPRRSAEAGLKILEQWDHRLDKGGHARPGGRGNPSGSSNSGSTPASPRSSRAWSDARSPTSRTSTFPGGSRAVSPRPSTTSASDSRGRSPWHRSPRGRWRRSANGCGPRVIRRCLRPPTTSRRSTRTWPPGLRPSG